MKEKFLEKIENINFFVDKMNSLHHRIYFKINIHEKDISGFTVENKENFEENLYKNYQINFNKNQKLRLFEELEKDSKSQIISNKNIISFLYSDFKDEIKIPENLEKYLPKVLQSSKPQTPSSFSLKKSQIFNSNIKYLSPER